MIELQQPIVRFTRRGNERFVYWSFGRAAYCISKLTYAEHYY